MQSILIAADGSEHALNAVKYAIKTIKQGLKADLHLINVQPVMITFGEVPLFDYTQIEESQRKYAEALLKPACKLLDEAGLKYTRHIRIGPVSTNIVDCAQAQHCDSIIMGTRGLGALKTWVLGSTANQVVHLADIPVTLVK